MYKVFKIAAKESQMRLRLRVKCLRIERNCYIYICIGIKLEYFCVFQYIFSSFPRCYPIEFGVGKAINKQIFQTNKLFFQSIA